MRITFFVFLLFFGFMNIVQAALVELVVAKYQALDYTEIRDVKNKKYDFNFCLCHQPSTHPNADHACECKVNRHGKTAADSIPKVIYPSSCLYTCDEDKCLSASFGSTSSKYLYVSIHIDNRVLTTPEWQSLQVTRYKKTVKLASCGNSKFIELTYSVLGDMDEKEVSSSMRVQTPHQTAHTQQKWHPTVYHSDSKSNNIEALQKLLQKHRSMMINHGHGHQSVTITTTRLQEPKYEGPNFKLENSRSFKDITLYLMELGLKQRINPPNFDIRSFKQAVLEAHNRYRYMHGVAPLTYDQGAENAAMAWARNLANRQACLDHDPQRRYGENLFYFGFELFTDPASMADALTYGFYMEGRGYNYNTIPYDYINRGHFTQMIWASSHKIGVGVAISYYNGRKRNQCQPNRPAYMLYVVVKYDPPGNVRVRRAYLDNVRPLRRRL